MAKAGTYFAGFLIFMVLLKDGTIPQLAQNAATFVQTGARGLRPITKVA